METQSEIGNIVRKLEEDFMSGQTTTSKYVSFNMADRLNRIDAYLASKHTTGDKDSKGRDKPFFNIVTAAVNIWYRSTDIDRKNIKIKAVKSSDTIDAFLATVHLQEWMRRDNFGVFLNQWGRTLSEYGSAVIKFVEKNGELHCNIIPWQRLLCDSIDFDNNIKVEVLELTEAQLRKREGYNQDIVDKLCEARAPRKTSDGQNKDNKDDYIRLYEIHGELPKSYLTGKEEDGDTYVQQMHVISFIAGKEKGEFDDFTLVSGSEDRDPYMITHLIHRDGQTLSVGAVEHLFDAQWMVNHSIKSIKDQLDLASKLIFQTSDPTFVGQNALNAIETGDILVHAVNQPLTQLSNSSHDISSLQSFGNQWKALSNEIVGVSESMLGNAAPSGTAWRQVEAILQESHSLFELMTENKGLAIENMFRKYVIPFLKKKMDTKEEVTATLSEYDLNRIDSKFVKNTANKVINRAILDMVLEGGEVTPEMQATGIADVQGQLQNSLSEMGNQRFFKPSDIDTKTWKEVFKDLEWEVEVDVTGESVDRDAVTTLNTMLVTIAKNPMILQNPDVRMLWNKILNITGTVSPLEVSGKTQPQPVQANPATAGMVGA